MHPTAQVYQVRNTLSFFLDIPPSRVPGARISRSHPGMFSIYSCDCSSECSIDKWGLTEEFPQCAPFSSLLCFFLAEDALLPTEQQFLGLIKVCVFTRVPVEAFPEGICSKSGTITLCNALRIPGPPNSSVGGLLNMKLFHKPSPSSRALTEQLCLGPPQAQLKAPNTDIPF